MPAENKWIWVKWPVWISLAEKYSSYWKYNSSLLVFFPPFLLLFYKLFTVPFRGSEIYKAIPVIRLFNVQFSVRKTLLYGLDKFSLWMTAKKLAKQGCCKHRKISAKLTNLCRGERSNSPLARVRLYVFSSFNASVRIRCRKIKVREFLF